MSAVRVLRRAAYLSHYEFFGLYAPKVWVVAWMPRVILETLFFALIAQFIGGRELLLFALVGLAGYRTLQSTLTFTTASVTAELFGGTVPLLVGSPTSPLLVLTGRNLAWTLHGPLTGGVTIAVALSLGLSVTPVGLAGALAVLVVIEFSAYALGVFVGRRHAAVPGFRTSSPRFSSGPHCSPSAVSTCRLAHYPSGCRRSRARYHWRTVC